MYHFQEKVLSKKIDYDDTEVLSVIGLKRSLWLCCGLAPVFCYCLCVNGTGVTDTSGPHCHADWWQKQFWPIWLLDVACLDTIRITGNLSRFFISWILYPFALKPQSLRGQPYLFSLNISQGWWVLFYDFILPCSLLSISFWVSGISLPKWLWRIPWVFCMFSYVIYIILLKWSPFMLFKIRFLTPYTPPPLWLGQGCVI